MQCMTTPLNPSPAPDDASACDNHGCGCSSSAVIPLAVTSLQPGWSSWRIATMDCSAEESEIRRAVDAVPGIKALRFQLGARTLGIQATEQALPLALDAIRKAGFDPQPLSVTGGTGVEANGDHAGRDHDHDSTQTVGEGGTRLALALGLAVLAEGLGFFAPETMVFKALGLAVAGVAIALAGLDTYRKGLSALRHGKLNINALMTVAVTGAFVIGQWPEAAMVMALYAIAELIEAKSVDKARNAIKGLLDLSPQQATVQQADQITVDPVGEEVVGGLDADGEADHVRPDAGGGELLVVQLGVRRRRVVDRQRARVADVREVREDLERLAERIGVVEHRAEEGGEVGGVEVVGHLLGGGVAHLRQRDARRAQAAGRAGS